MTAIKSSGLTAWRNETFSPLQNGTFRLIWLAGSASYIGSMIQSTSAAWLMTSMTDSPLLISLVQTAVTLPFVALALFSGALADSIDRRLQMLAGNVICFICVFALAVMTRFEMITPISLLALSALISTGAIIIGPAWQASVWDIVERKRLTAAISLNNLSFNLARCVGPALAAEVLVYVGAAASFFINSATYLLVIFAVFAWRKAAKPKAIAKQRVGTAIRDGLQYARLSPHISAILLRVSLISFFASTVLALPPLLVVSLDAGARGLGFVLGSFGIGAMVGSLTLAYVRARTSLDRLVGSNCLLLGTMLIATSTTDTLWVATVLFVFMGFGWIQTVAALQITLQMSCPRWVTGRVISIFSMALSLGIALGSAFWGGVAASSSMSLAFCFSGLGLCSVVSVILLWPFTQPDETALEPSALLRPPSVPDVDIRSGPVHITIVYTVVAGSLPAFRAAMNALELQRCRDGARNWSLSQDIDDPARWAEAFESPTWGDYLRRASRRLKADDKIQEAVLACCEYAPIRRRRIKRPSNAADLEDPEYLGSESDERQIPWAELIKSI